MRSPLLLPLIVACALFMEGIDSTVIATSLPAIAADLNENPIALKLALTSYLISLAVFIPVSGWTANRFGSRVVFAGAIVVFVVGSIMCAFSDSLAWFVGARFFQGLGGAMMVPVGRLILLRTVPKAEIIRALNFLMIPALVGPVIGPPLGGLITTFLHWRWIFLINIPIGILGFIMVLRHVPNIIEPDPPPLDWTGFALSSPGLGLLMMGLTTLGEHLVSTTVSVTCIVVGSAMLALYVRHARRTPHPLMDLSLLRIQGFRAGLVGGSFSRIATGAMPFLLPLLMQLGFGMNAFASGLVTCAASIGSLFMKTLSERILRRWGFKRVLIVCAFVGAALIVICGLFTPDTPLWLIVALLVLGGCCRSLQFTATNALCFGSVESERMSHATGMSAVTQQVSRTLGVTLSAYALQFSMLARGSETMAGGDFLAAFFIVGLIGLLAVPYFLRLPAEAGDEMSGHKQHRT